MTSRDLSGRARDSIAHAANDTTGARARSRMPRCSTGCCCCCCCCRCFGRLLRGLMSGGRCLRAAILLCLMERKWTDARAKRSEEK